MDGLISRYGAETPTPLELELLRDIALLSEDASLRIAVTIARTVPALAAGATLTEAVCRANARCLLEIERWRTQPVKRIDTPRLIDMAVSATRGSDYHALRVIRDAMNCPVKNATPAQALAFEVCLTAWNSRAARLAGAA